MNKIEMNPDNFSIRPFEPTDTDYSAIVKLFNQDRSGLPSTITIWKTNDDNRNSKEFYRRYIGEIKTNKGKKIIATGIISKKGLFDEPGKYFITYCIDHAFINKGLDELMYNHLLSNLGEDHLIELKTEIFGEHAYKLNFLLKKGFKQHANPKRYSELNVTNFKLELFKNYTQKVTESGIKISTLKELQKNDINWMKKLYKLETSIQKDLSDETDSEPLSIAEYAEMFENPNFLPEAQFIALDEGVYVGISSLWKDTFFDDLLWVGTTSVLPSYKRKGIATALKVRTIAFAKSYGINKILTRNIENSPMQKLNLKLGFKQGILLQFFSKVM